ncbi:MAG: hypothetical protein D6680_07460 [Cyanobacteria bacterium J007]|jgi:hypothetical protein|nr:MAG: hypothetical protein D6680_07460 [Cyanobacteria bacterium J007]
MPVIYAGSSYLTGWSQLIGLLYALGDRDLEGWGADEEEETGDLREKIIIDESTVLKFLDRISLSQI